MNDTEDSRAGVFVFVWAGLLGLCLLGAFVLPAGWLSGRTLGWFGLVGLLAMPFLDIAGHRARVRKAVEERGVLVSFKRIPWWRRGYYQYNSLARVRYQLEYVDFSGATHQALCNSGWFSGVEWLEDRVMAGPAAP